MASKADQKLTEILLSVCMDFAESTRKEFREDGNSWTVLPSMFVSVDETAGFSE